MLLINVRNCVLPTSRHVIRSSDNVQLYPPIDGIKFPWSEEEEREGGGGERGGEDCSREIVGAATVQETFTVTNKKNKSKETIFGSKIVSGELSASLKYQITRDDEVIADGLSLASLKHHKKSVSSLDKGHECGICFDAKRSSYECQSGDVIQCYREVKNDEPRFSFKPGVVKSF